MNSEAVKDSGGDKGGGVNGLHVVETMAPLFVYRYSSYYSCGLHPQSFCPLPHNYFPIILFLNLFFNFLIQKLKMILRLYNLKIIIFLLKKSKYTI